MKTTFGRRLLLQAAPILMPGFSFGAAPATNAKRIRLIIRVDDMGATHAINAGCAKTLKEGIARTVEVIAPGPWVPEAVAILKTLPNVDVGVHLALTSEWESVKWRPLTHAPSLVDADGFFFPTVKQRSTFPPGTALLDAKPRLAEIEAELRAQISLVKRHCPRTSHISAHMGVTNFSSEWLAIARKLCGELGISAEDLGLKPVRLPPAANQTLEERLFQALSDLPPGDHLFVEHPGEDSPELRSLRHIGYDNTATDRVAVTHALCSPRIKALVLGRGIILSTYGELAKEKRG